MSYYLKKDIKFKKVGQGYLFENGIGVNDTSFRIYELCTKNSFDEIIMCMKKEYSLEDISKEKFAKEIKECLKNLTEVGLVEIVN